MLVPNDWVSCAIYRLGYKSFKMADKEKLHNNENKCWFIDVYVELWRTDQSQKNLKKSVVGFL